MAQAGEAGAGPYDGMVAGVGRERYAQACQWAWKTAAGCHLGGEGPPWPGDLQDVPHELCFAEMPPAEELALSLRIYREMPCYWNATPFDHLFPRPSRADRAWMWTEYRAMLASERDELADPLSYLLRVNLFEDPAIATEALVETTRRDVAPWERRVRRVLHVAGPAPWAGKEARFAELIDDLAWHPHVFAALEGSAFDTCGQRGPSAVAWLDALELPTPTLRFRQVREHLGGR